MEWAIRHSVLASRSSTTSDGGEQVGKLFLDLLSQLGPGAGDHREIREPPNSCTHTPGPPERPARSTAAQIMPAFITHLLKEKSDGGRIGEAMPRMGSSR